MSMLTHPLTNADLERERELRDERIELIEGELFVTPSPIPFHQFVSQRLYDLLKRAVVDQDRGLIGYAPLDVRLDEHTIVQPDLIVLLGTRTTLIGEKAIEGSPSLVIEIASPSTAGDDQRRKRMLYARFDVPEYWFVDPTTRRVTVYSDPANGRYRKEQMSDDTAVSATIQGLSADVSRLFRPVHER